MRGHFFITMGYGILLPLRAFRSQGLLFFFCGWGGERKRDATKEITEIQFEFEPKWHLNLIFKTSNFMRIVFIA